MDVLWEAAKGGILTGSGGEDDQACPVIFDEFAHDESYYYQAERERKYSRRKRGVDRRSKRLRSNLSMNLDKAPCERRRESS